MGNATTTDPVVSNDDAPPQLVELIVVHQTTVYHPSKGWRVTVRIQDGWQGATLSHWSRGGSDCLTGCQKAADDARVALEEGLTYLEAF